MELLQTILAIVFTLVILVGFHELGHFWVARRCGVKVKRFSIGFGKPLLRWRDKHDTEFVLAAVPLGGYVKMLDEREAPVAPDQLRYAFNRQSAWRRLMVVLAGPVANFILAIAIYWLIFLHGVSGIVPVIGAIDPDSVAARAGLVPNSEIVAVDGKPTPTWEMVYLQLLDRLGDSGNLHFTTKALDSSVIYQTSAPIQHWLSNHDTVDLVAALGIERLRPPMPPILATVAHHSAAEQAGLRAGDKIISANGQPVPTWASWVDIVRSHAGQPIDTVYERRGQRHHTQLTPRTMHDNGVAFGQVGVSVQEPEWPEAMRRTISYTFVGAGIAAIERTWHISVFTLTSIKRMLEGLISPKNLSGPVTIARVAATSAQSGWLAYLKFLALLNVSLGILNLLPIPVLDGGQAVFILIESVMRRPVPEYIQILSYQLGLLLIVGVMMLALYNDITHW